MDGSGAKDERGGLAQTAEGPEVQVQLLEGEIEAAREVADGLLQPHERQAEGFRFRSGQGLGLHATQRLSLEETTQKLDQGQDQSGHRPLDVLRVRIPARGLGGHLSLERATQGVDLLAWASPATCRPFHGSSSPAAVVGANA
jgi:hypothetical protein